MGDDVGVFGSGDMVALKRVSALRRAGFGLKPTRTRVLEETFVFFVDRSGSATWGFMCVYDACLVMRPDWAICQKDGFSCVVLSPTLSLDANDQPLQDLFSDSGPPRHSLTVGRHVNPLCSSFPIHTGPALSA